LAACSSEDGEKFRHFVWMADCFDGVDCRE
jgi:hypothetical protein